MASLCIGSAFIGVAFVPSLCIDSDVPSSPLTYQKNTDYNDYQFKHIKLAMALTNKKEIVLDMLYD